MALILQSDMPTRSRRRIGIHTSTSGALFNAATKAIELGANCFQIFSGSPRTWAAPLPKPEACARMAELRAAHDLTPLVIHANYLINLCSADAANRPKSIAAFRGELERAALIGAEFLVVHPGSAKDHPHRDSAIAAFAEGLAEASRGLAPSGVSILLENTAGHGNLLGGELSDLRAIRDLAAPHVAFPIGYCLDTCHSYAAGYDITTDDGLRAFTGEADTLLGLENVPVIHTNDSKGALGSHLDRHANIGEGYIGLEGFRRILNARALRDKAFILETPVDNEGDDQRNVDALWSLVK
jgi:deoxyribonuclease-4